MAVWFRDENIQRLARLTYEAILDAEEDDAEQLTNVLEELWEYSQRNSGRDAYEYVNRLIKELKRPD